MKEFGTDFTLDCTIGLAEFISDRSLTKYYELLVQTSDSTYAEVPVQNTGNAISQYASRFIIVDNVSGFQVAPTTTAATTEEAVAANTYLIPENLPNVNIISFPYNILPCVQFISIASEMVMTIKIQSNNKINMPTLSITYKTINVADILSGTKYSISFKVTIYLTINNIINKT